MKKLIAGTMAAMLAVSMVGCGSSGSSSTAAAGSTAAGSTAAEAATGIDYPTKNIQGSIMWSAGGVCDTVSRAIGVLAQDDLGQTIVFTNRAGSGGGVSTAYVNAQAAEGYELLFGAENPQIAKVMGTSEIDYDDFIPIDIFCNSYGVVCVAADSEYQTIEDLVDDVVAQPGQVIMATTGAGGLPETVAAMMADVNGTQPNMVAFDGENECMTNIMGGNADYTVVTLGSAASFYQSGDVRILAVINDSALEGFEDVPAITDSYPDYSKYLPWGPFYGVFVKAGTDQAVVDKLTEAFVAAGENQEFLDLLAAKGCFAMNLTGNEAVEYLQHYRATTSYLLYDTGVATNDPADFGIERE